MTLATKTRTVPFVLQINIRVFAPGAAFEVFVVFVLVLKDIEGAVYDLAGVSKIGLVFVGGWFLREKQYRERKKNRVKARGRMKE